MWHTTGKIEHDPAANFLGTADNQPLEVRVNNQRALRIEPASDGTGFLPNVIGGKDNFVAPGTTGAFIGGGGGVNLSNTIASTESVIAGGFLNHIEAGNAHASFPAAALTTPFCLPRRARSSPADTPIASNS